MDADAYKEVQAKLLESRAAWERRLDAIQADRRRQNSPLEADFEEQAVQRENDAALDALDARGRQELEAIESALRRLESGAFGRCGRCGETIATKRLEAQPTAATCLPCARESGAGVGSPT